LVETTCFFVVGFGEEQSEAVLDVAKELGRRGRRVVECGDLWIGMFIQREGERSSGLE
jgi:hypothetical protein